MRPNRLLLAVFLLVTPSLFLDANTDAQGLLRRLRDRIAREPAADNSDGKLPARPRGTSDASSPEPATSPTPAGATSAVQQASATTPNDPSANRNRPLRSSGFGRSILAPLGFGNNPDRQPKTVTTGASIGIKAINANPGYPAIQITEFLPHSVADEAGLKVGDYIFAINGVATPTVPKLVEQVATLRPGDTVRLRFGRSGSVRELDVQLAAKPASNLNRSGASRVSPRSLKPAPLKPVRSQPAADYRSNAATSSLAPSDSVSPRISQDIGPKIGADLQDVTGRRGIEVRSIQPGSIAEAAGLKTGDRIVAIDGRMISDMNGLVEWLSSHPPESTAEIRLIRNNELVDVTLSFAANAKRPVTNAAAANQQPGQAPVAVSAEQEKSSILGGIGSVFGGMFSKAPSPVDSSATDSKGPKNAPGDLSLDTDMAELPSPALPPIPSILQKTKQTDDSAVDQPSLQPSKKSTEKKPQDSKTLQEEIQRIRSSSKTLSRVWKNKPARDGQ